MKVKAIFFDFDNTLVGTDLSTELAYKHIKEILNSQEDSTKAHCYLKQHLSQWADDAISHFKYHLRSTPNDLYKREKANDVRIELWQNSITHVLSKAKLTDVPMDHIKGLAAELYYIWHATRLQNLEFLEENSREVLQKLHLRHKLVLITNGCSSIQWEKIEHSQIEKYFDYTIVSGDEPDDKPHKSIFLKACGLCGVDPGECAMVGDSIRTDIRGANAAGLASSVLFTNKPETLKLDALDSVDRPTSVISSVSQLLDMF